MLNQATSAFVDIKTRISDHLGKCYPNENIDVLADIIIRVMGFENGFDVPEPHTSLWDEADVVAITYGDSIKKADEKPLSTLHDFLSSELKNVINTVHILPFYPFSSDDGFSVINYTEVNQSLGDWDDIKKIARDFRIMADLVINHCSSRSVWFDNYKQCKDPGSDYFIECDQKTDLSTVVRPRTSPLLRRTDTLSGEKYVWCTFSHDQIDLNFKNPRVLIEFVKIINFYMEQGVSLFRLDAVAFLWKEIGTPCINLIETHEIIRLLRLLVEHKNKDAIIVTETNIPNRENLSYFGNANEAHLIYNFSLPPLILYTLLTGKSDFLKQWMMSMPPARNGTAYFNFIASHDGIGLRPVEGILSDEQVNDLADLMKSFGGDVSYREHDSGRHKPYELNISLIDALKGTFEGEDDYRLERFTCAHAIMLSLEGIPAFYIHSLFATPNDYTKMELTSNKRAINRHNWDYDDLVKALKQEGLNKKVFSKLTQIISIRKQQKAFHPNATQFTLHFEESLFALWRQSQDRAQSIFCIYNIANKPQSFELQDVNLVELDDWRDLLTGRKYTDAREVIELQPYEFVWITNT